MYHLGIKQAVDFSTLSRANEKRDWRIFADFGAHLIATVQPLYADSKVSHLELKNDIFALDSTTISVSLKLWNWARGKYSRGAVKMHTLLDLRGNIPVFIHVTDGRYHDVNALDEIEVIPKAIYVMGKAYIDFERLYALEKADAYFVVRAKSNMRFKAVESRKVAKPNGFVTKLLS